MIISRTPFRISFFGGGTDYPVWFKEHGGLVLGTTIDKYCYISCRDLPPFFEHKYRIIYSRMEHVKEIDDIQHPSVRNTIKFMNINNRLEIHHDADLPARSGLGSSSSFTVGLLNCLYAFKGIMPKKMSLAEEAIHIEQNLIKENVGNQDQIHASFGGLNLIEFKQNNLFSVNPITIGEEKKTRLNKNLHLFFTGFSRFASDIAVEQIKQTKCKENELSEMQSFVYEGINLLSNPSDGLNDFGRLLDETWKLKRSLTDKISNSSIDEIYKTGLQSGALGGKLLGAGGGGFILFYCEQENEKRLRENLKKLLHVPFNFENQGTQIIFYNE